MTCKYQIDPIKSENVVLSLASSKVARVLNIVYDVITVNVVNTVNENFRIFLGK